MQIIEKTILNTLHRKGRGFVFSNRDFSDKSNATSIDKSLSLLAQRKQIRRISQGLYDFPRYNDIIKEVLPPNIEIAAKAIARKLNWKIIPTGNKILNDLGLSTQVPSKYVFLSSGPSKIYNIMGASLEFKKVASKNINFKHEESALLVNAIKTIGLKNISDEVISIFRKNIPSNKYQKIIKDTKHAEIKVYDIIKKICQSE